MSEIHTPPRSLKSHPIQPAASAGALGGLLAAASVGAEIVHPVQAADGTSREPGLHAAYLVAWLIGWSLIGLMAFALRRFAAHGARTGRIGAWSLVGGAAAFVVSGLGLLIGVLTGTNIEVLFVLFLVAFPLLIVGSVLLALRSAGLAGMVRALLIVAAAGFLVALLAEMDPFHDIGLITATLAMGGIGLTLSAGGVPRRSGVPARPPRRGAGTLS